METIFTRKFILKMAKVEISAKAPDGQMHYYECDRFSIEESGQVEVKQKTYPDVVHDTRHHVVALIPATYLIEIKYLPE